ncbi:MAG: MBL fold metallo-hydrolase [Streptosporangiaceae bacterium]
MTRSGTTEPLTAAGPQVWSEPGPEEIVPGVHRIPLPLPTDGLCAVNVYAIETGDGLVLIDSGWAVAAARTELRRAIRAIGYDFPDVRRFLVTHVHRDHYTQAVELRAEFGARIALGAGERASLRAAADVSVSPIAAQLRTLRRAGAEQLAWQIAGPGSGDSTDRLAVLAARLELRVAADRPVVGYYSLAEASAA